MHLFVPTMDAFLVEFTADGQVRFEGEDLSTPTLQETRAIIHAATNEIETLQELLGALSSETR
jgi:hypothetical protein